MAYAAVAEPSRRADIWFGEPARQRRWTVLIRFLLAIPQLIVIAILAVATEVVAIIGWFGALFMGRLPEWVHTFIGGFLRWQARVNAYCFLLTDQYPPYEFADEPYAARPLLPGPGPLNRLAVFFRIVLAIPASVLGALVSYGLSIPLLFITWLIMVCTGQMPASLYGAYAASIRYQYRLSAYLFLLTSEYPWGILGDRASERLPGGMSPAAPPAGPPAAPPAWSMGSSPPPPPPVVPAWLPPPPPTPAAGAMPPPPPSEIAAPPPPDGGAERGRLVLSRASRVWMLFAIAWGVVLVAGYAAGVVSISFHFSTTTSQHDAIVNDFNAPNGPKATVQAAITASQHCTTVACLRPSHFAAASSLQLFAAEVRGMSLPSNAQDPAGAVESDADQLASAFTKLANSANAQAYRTTVEKSGLNTLLQSLPADTNNLLNALNQSVF
ncbi:MAG TPA: DUF4389 domain-containing protein [Acidimicrobiales bacterium]|jgi:hypothetical protein|nr:DUF4389 domain-containing protein [Acidimicrobiales bacterium]